MANLHSEMRITDTTVISHLKSARSVPQFALPSGAGSIWGKGGATAEPKRLLRTVDHIQGANLEYQFTLLGDPSSSPRPPVPKHSRWTRRLRSSASLSNRWRPFPADALSRPPGGRAGGRSVLCPSAFTTRLRETSTAAGAGQTVTGGRRVTARSHALRPRHAEGSWLLLRQPGVTPPPALRLCAPRSGT